MKISARNQLKGKVKSIKHGPVSTEVVISVANGVGYQRTDSRAKTFDIASAICRRSSGLVRMWSMPAESACWVSTGPV